MSPTSDIRDEFVSLNQRSSEDPKPIDLENWEKQISEDFINTKVPCQDDFIRHLLLPHFCYYAKFIFPSLWIPLRSPFFQFLSISFRCVLFFFVGISTFFYQIVSLLLVLFSFMIFIWTLFVFYSQSISLHY